MISALAVWFLDPAFHRVTRLDLLWRNTLPSALFALLIYGLLGRFLLSLWLVLVLAKSLFAVNAIKVAHMNAPLMPSDWALKDQLLHHLPFFAAYAGGSFLLLAGLAAFVLITWLIVRCQRRWGRPHPVIRIAFAVTAVAILFSLFHGDGVWKQAYSDTELAGYYPSDPVVSVSNTGLMAGLVKFAQEAINRVPKPDTEIIAAFAKKHSQELHHLASRPIPAQLPDIVVVQSEAFFDPSIMKQIEPGDFEPNFRRLASTGITGSMEAPTYGGGTIRTEFETLTGYPMRAFPHILYPYYGLAGKWMPSVPRRLQMFDYSTTLFHPFGRNFWNRQEVMPALGFQHSYYEDFFKNAARAGVYVSDQASFDTVLAHLAKPQAKPSYTMLITMENHGPWSLKAKALPHILDDRPLPKGLSPNGAEQLTYYLSHLVNGDMALGDFAAQLMARPRWTVLVFYGDHLPSLNAAFEDIGFDDGKTYADQRTHYMLISNRPLQPRKLDLSAYELPGLLFDTIGLPKDGYLAFDGAMSQAESGDSSERASHYEQVSINAARHEVRCKEKIQLDGSCRKKSAVQ
ncbi:MAG TPA: LTA synthase family protein [Rhodanobacter sp.]|nr:LTA synthase family protein [Rhodanobacter sp.]